VLIVPTFLTPAAALVGALVGGSASLAAAIYKERAQYRLQRVTAEVSRRETVYADFVMSASRMLLNAHLRDDIALDGEEQRLVGLINRMRLFAPQEVLASAETALRAIVDIYLKPSVDLPVAVSDVNQGLPGSLSPRLEIIRLI